MAHEAEHDDAMEDGKLIQLRGNNFKKVKKEIVDFEYFQTAGQSIIKISDIETYKYKNHYEIICKITIGDEDSSTTYNKCNYYFNDKFEMITKDKVDDLNNP